MCDSEEDEIKKGEFCMERYSEMNTVLRPRFDLRRNMFT
jgi:hypothetical protein